jgi:tyrosine-protein phosphatase SIW14
MSFRARGLVTLLILALPAWAASSKAPVINNFAELDPEVYRGAQPTDEGIRYLAELGIKVVLDLREHDSRSLAEERVVTAAGMRYVNVPMTGMTPPTQAETNTVLHLLEDPAAGPVFVHCRRGADRTGAVIAAYRIDHDGWENARALKEAMASGMSVLQFRRQRYIRTLQARTREASGTTPAETPNRTDAGSLNLKAANSAAAGSKN